MHTHTVKKFKVHLLLTYTWSSNPTYSKTSLIRAAWDQGVSVTKKMPVTEK